MRKNKKSERIANDTDNDTLQAAARGSPPAARRAQAAQPAAARGNEASAPASGAAAEEVRGSPTAAAPTASGAGDSAPAPAATLAPSTAARRAPDAALAGLFEVDPVEQPRRGREYESLDELLDGLELPALLELRNEIDERLPPRTLESVDLLEELMLQYHLAKSLMTRVSNDGGTPANQKAQVINSCASVLEQVTKTQTALYTAERVKLMEQALEKAMQGVPLAVKTAFLDRYAALLAEATARRQEKKTQ